MAPYQAFRQYGLPAYYPENKTAVTVDVVLAGICCAIFILALSFIVIIPGMRNRERISYVIRIGISLYIGAAILLANFGQDWETAEIKTKTQYKAFISKEIKASIGVKIGLRSVNVTLKGEPVNQVGEQIDYNERFTWVWDQGRIGFGPFAGEISREFREAQWKGLPYPIIWIAEYFVLDGENIRWGRSYRTAGFFTHLCLWFAFPLWLLTIVLFGIIVRYGAYFLFINGTVLLLANLLFATLRWGPELTIPFKDAVIQFQYGWCFWVTLITGFLCIVLGGLILLLDYYLPAEVATFFGHDVIENYEECFVEEYRQVKPQEGKPPSPSEQNIPSNEGKVRFGIDRGAPPPVPAHRGRGLSHET
ncbi:dual oxidase maturation factor 1-like [Ptychodera flava]|uniref:dual oxidase maturation factor 1-like n=1 Tax=Ptychodera flava TaxID=63121 RepID=UPI00396A3A4B